MINNSENLSLFITMSFFFCNITEENYQSAYDKLNSTLEADYKPSDFAVWHPFVDYYDLNDLLDEVDKHREYIHGNIDKYENSNSKRHA